MSTVIHRGTYGVHDVLNIFLCIPYKLWYLYSYYTLLYNWLRAWWNFTWKHPILICWEARIIV